jgi:glycerate 2-kinase
MKILIAPDKFKDSLTAQQVCEAIGIGINKILPESQIIKVPLADGGEGSLKALESFLQFIKIYVEVNDPLFRKIKTYYGLLNKTAFIEMAKASGLQLLKTDERNPMYTSSFGTGELILDALNKGAKKIFLFVGGSSTNDCGIGIASALGFKFKDKQNSILKPVGSNLPKIKSIENDNLTFFENIEVKVLTDVKNVLFGKNGAAFVYAKQKGANESEIIELDKGLQNVSQIIKSKFNIDVSEVPGSGAAGGIGAGLIAFLNARISSGTETILDLLKIDDQIKSADLVITGEGLLDKQTLEGKVVNGIIDRCKKFNKSLGIICGDTTLTKKQLSKINVVVKTIKTKEISKEDSIKNAHQYLIQKSEELIKEIVVY